MATMNASTTYKGCTYYKTSTTTDTTRYAYGTAYEAIARVWGVSGRLSKPAGQRPFLTSASACREWINEQDVLSAPLSGQEEDERDRQHAREQDAWQATEMYHAEEV